MEFKRPHPVEKEQVAEKSQSIVFQPMSRYRVEIVKGNELVPAGRPHILIVTTVDHVHAVRILFEFTLADIYKRPNDIPKGLVQFKVDSLGPDKI